MREKNISFKNFPNLQCTCFIYIFVIGPKSKTSLKSCSFPYKWFPTLFCFFLCPLTSKYGYHWRPVTKYSCNLSLYKVNKIYCQDGVHRKICNAHLHFTVISFIIMQYNSSQSEEEACAKSTNFCILVHPSKLTFRGMMIKNFYKQPEHIFKYLFHHH